MSKKKEPSLSRKDMKRILSEEETGCLCLCESNEPYAVPVSYAFLDGVIVFHCGKAGRKLDLIRANPQVCFVVSRYPDRTKPHHAEEGCNFRYESVLCFGRARIVASPLERLKHLREFKAHFDRRLGLEPGKNPVSESAAEKANCVVIKIDKMTGRKRR